MAPYLPPKRLRVYPEYAAASPDHFSSYQEDIRHYTNEFLRIAREEGLDPNPEALYQWLGAASIRFTELQNASDDDFIGADEFFDDLPEDPFTEGCEVTLPNQYGLPLQVIVKVTCGRVNCRKPPVTEQPVRTGVTRVLYPNGEVSHGWKTARTDDCHAGGCHGPSMQTGGCHSDGCH